jgi:hypothetical protein
VAVLVEAVDDFEDVWREDHEGGESLEGGRGGGKAGFSVDLCGDRVGKKEMGAQVIQELFLLICALGIEAD